MTFRYEEIGQRLKAFRMGSGLGADEIARKIGISRTALYRFETRGAGEDRHARQVRGAARGLDRDAARRRHRIPSRRRSAISSACGRSRRPPSRSSFSRGRSPSCWRRMISRPRCRRCCGEHSPRPWPIPRGALSDIPLIMEILAATQGASIASGGRRIVNLMSAFELERFLDHGFVGRKGMPDGPAQAARRWRGPRSSILPRLLEAPADRRADRHRPRHAPAHRLPDFRQPGLHAAGDKPVPSRRASPMSGSGWP